MLARPFPAGHLIPALALILALSFILAVSGCGSQPPSQEKPWKEEVSNSLKSCEECASYRFRLKMETWIGVSGQSVFGDEKGEGSYAGGNFYLQLQRTSPAGDEALAVASREERFYLQENGVWKGVEMDELPNPLYNPRFLAKLVAGHGSVTLEGEEERGGTACRRYLLQLGADKARDAFSARAWSYFSNLRYELNCRLWVSDPSSPPAAIRLEVVGFDQDESLQRYRSLTTMEPYDVGSPDILVPEPDTEGG